MNIAEMLSIGITTKGRVNELHQTLSIIEASELKPCPIILIDDGGGGEFIRKEDFDLDLHIHRYQENEGLVARRNELADLCQTKYIMSLDDDSAPESGSIEDVIEVLEAEECVVTVAFNLYNDDAKRKGTDCPDYESRYFVGCGHIHDVEVFKRLGGYTGDLIYGHEEIEYALKLGKAAKKIIHKNNYIVKHRRSVVCREAGYNPRMSRNAGWINGTYLGLVSNLIELYSCIKGKDMKHIMPVLKDYHKGVVSRDKVEKLSFSQYWSWKRKRTPTVA
jgi:glycosyltransferase involved in cell wall biosynthesis